MSDAPGKPYRPKDLALISASFGRDRGIRWHASATDDHLHTGRVTAARLQHGLMYAIAQATAMHPGSALQHAKHAGINSDRMGRIRRGDLPMRVEELGLLCAVFKIPIQRVVAVAGLQPRDLVRAQSEAPRTDGSGSP